DGAPMPLERFEGLSCVGIPYSNRLVLRCGDDACAVGAERSRPDAAAMLECFKGLSCLGVPYSGGVVLRRGDDVCAVRAEDGRAHGIAMSFKTHTLVMHRQSGD